MTTSDAYSMLYNARLAAKEKRAGLLSNYEGWHDVVPGVVFSVGGSIDVPHNPNRVWVREWGVRGGHKQALKSSNVYLAEGVGVIMKPHPKDPYLYQIIDLWKESLVPVQMKWADRYQYGVHGPNHWYPTEATKGPDPVLIWPPALQMLKSVPSGTDMTVTVGPLYYGVGPARKYFPGDMLDTVVDLSSYVPAAGYLLRALIYLYVITNTLDVAVSATVADTDIPDFPDTPADGIASAYFLLTGGQTVIDATTDYIDARRFLTESGGTASIDDPTAAGQMLFADASLNWVAGKIVTSGGYVVVSGGDVVWSPT